MPRSERLQELLKPSWEREPVNSENKLATQNAFSTGLERVRTSISNAVSYAVTRLNQMIESVKEKFRTLKSKVSQTFKSRDTVRTFVTNQVNSLVKHANLESIQEAWVAIREAVDRRILSHFKSKKAFLQLLEPIKKKYEQLKFYMFGTKPTA
jgi:hypothetical protein